MSSLFFDSDSGVCYRNLGFLGFPLHRIGDDGTAWKLRKGVWELLKTIPVGRYGHLKVHLTYHGTTDFLVHRLVLLAFAGPPPVDCETCHFPDRDPRNNRLENLKWGTPKENSSHTQIHGTRNDGERNGGCKTTESTVRELLKLWDSGNYTQKQLGEMFGIARPNVYAIVHRKSWRRMQGLPRRERHKQGVR